MSQRHQPYSRVLTAFFCLTLLACQSESDQNKTPASTAPGDEVVLGTESPKRGYIKEAVVEASRRPLMARVNAKIVYDETRTVRVSSPIAGRVVGPIAQLGDVVQAKTPLLQLDSPELGQAQSDYAAATADLNLAERAFQRMKGLYEQGITPRKEYEQAVDALDRARSEAERARLKLANLGVQGEHMDERFILHAPIGGTVTERNVNPGMEVRPDLTAPLFVLSDLSRLWVLMDVFEKDLGLVHTGQKVLVSVPAYPGETFEGSVDYISRTVDETTRTVKVRCTVQNLNGKLLPAMYASAEVQSDPGDLAVVVPLSALFTEGESDWLFVAVGDGRYQKRPIKVGLRFKDRAVITDGLAPGERLVVDGALLLRTEEETEQEGGEQAP